MPLSKRALLVGALVAATIALSAGVASAVTISGPGGLINTSGPLQTLRVPSLGYTYTYTCTWNIGGPILLGSVALTSLPVAIGPINFATIGCN